MRLNSSPTSACSCASKWNRNGLATKRSAGVTTRVNLINPLHTGDEAHKLGIHDAFETQGRRHQKSKSGYQWPHRKDSCHPPKKNFKRLKRLRITCMLNVLCWRVFFISSWRRPFAARMTATWSLWTFAARRTSGSYVHTMYPSCRYVILYCYGTRYIRLRPVHTWDF